MNPAVIIAHYARLAFMDSSDEEESISKIEGYVEDIIPLSSRLNSSNTTSECLPRHFMIFWERWVLYYKMKNLSMSAILVVVLTRGL